MRMEQNVSGRRFGEILGMREIRKSNFSFDFLCAFVPWRCIKQRTPLIKAGFLCRDYNRIYIENRDNRILGMVILFSSITAVFAGVAGVGVAGGIVSVLLFFNTLSSCCSSLRFCSRWSSSSLRCLSKSCIFG